MARYISRQEAAKRLGCTTQTVSNWVDRGILTARRTGRNIYIDGDTVDARLDTLQDMVATEQRIRDWQEQLDNKSTTMYHLMRDLRKDMGFAPLLVAYVEDIARSMSEVMQEQSAITERQATVFARVFAGDTLEDIADYLNLTRERVRQILAKAIRSFGHIRKYNDIVKENEALAKENKELKMAFSVIAKRNRELEVEAKVQEDKLRWRSDADPSELVAILSVNVQDLNLSVRALNCLKSADIDTIGDLVSCRKEDLLKFRNFGNKSLMELEEVLAEMGLTFNMDIKPYVEYVAKQEKTK